jgi:DNA-binding transcriptional LysR family regulator
MDVVLGTRHELGISWILPQIDRLKEAHPSIELHLYFGSGPDLVNRVRSMQIDCAVTSTRLGDPKLEGLRLHREDYVFVGAASMLAKNPLAREEQAPRHTLLDAHGELPLFRYFRDAPGGGDRLRFGGVVLLGTIEAIRRRVLAGAGVAVLPEYIVRRDLATRAVKRVFPKVPLLTDYFRLIFRADDARRSVYEAMARHFAARPLS